MHKHITTLLFFLLMIAIVLAVKFTKEYENLTILKNQIVQEETRSLSTLMVSFRETYQDIFIHNKISMDKEMMKFLPAKTTTDIASKFSEIMGDQTVIRTVSDRPRNMINTPSKEEREIIEFFKNNPNEESFFEQKEEYLYYYAQPLYIRTSCLKCHGDKEKTIPYVQKNYKTAFGYELGELRGILSIKISKKDIIDKIDNNFFSNVKIVSILFIFFLFALYTLIKMILRNEEEYAKNLEAKVTAQVKEIRTKDEMLFHQSKMASMGEMIGNIAHQWRQPLSTISSAASGMKLQKEFAKLDDETFDNSIDTIVHSTQHLSKTIDDFRNFFLTSEFIVSYNLKDVMDETLSLLSATLKDNYVEVIHNIDDTIIVDGYKRELTQALLNILNNAKDALKNLDAKEKRYIFIDIYKVENVVHIKVKDNGKGIKEDIIDRIFEPYFTTKHQLQGTGIGLYMTNQIINDHLKGTIVVTNETYIHHYQEQKGAQFLIKFKTL